MGWILFEVRVMRNAASTVLGAISGIRSIRLIHGKPDFTRLSGRYKLPIKALKRGVVHKMKTPLPIEISERAVQEYNDNGGSGAFFRKHYGAITAFSFLLREQELANLMEKDISHGEADGERFATIFISKSKTDQDGRGVFRPLASGKGKICVAQGLARWLPRTNWNPDGDRLSFGQKILQSLQRLLQWLCAMRGLPVGMYPTHSFRVGGATALHCIGAPFDVIRRFGRWASDCFKIYLHGDEIALRYLGAKIVGNHGLLAQHRLVAKTQRDVHFEEVKSTDYATREYGGEVGGYGQPHGGFSSDSRRSDSLPDTGDYTATPCSCATTMSEGEYEREEAHPSQLELRFPMGE